MKMLSSPQELDVFRASVIKKRNPKKPVITICGGTGCQASGSNVIIKVLKKEIKKHSLQDTVPHVRTKIVVFGPIQVR